MFAANASGTLWQGLGAGPLTAAVGLEGRENKTDNAGTEGGFYQRADLANVWADAFGGTTRVAEAYTELDLPLVSGQEGINLFSINGAIRYGWYHNKGGAGTTGESAKQTTPNWKVSTQFEPFDWVRLRLTRSRDLRAADYRDLFLYQPDVPDSQTIRNPWRAGTHDNENQQELYGRSRRQSNLNRDERHADVGLVRVAGGPMHGRASPPITSTRRENGINSHNTLQSRVDLLRGPTRQTTRTTSCEELTSAARQPEPRPVQGTRSRRYAMTGQLIQRSRADLWGASTGPLLTTAVTHRRGMAFTQLQLPLSRAFESLPGSMSLNRAVHARAGILRHPASNQHHGVHVANPSVACGEARTGPLP